MITGDKYFSPNNSLDLKEINASSNIHGERVKVILITKAAAEGLDFKNVLLSRPLSLSIFQWEKALSIGFLRIIISFIWGL